MLGLALRPSCVMPATVKQTATIIFLHGLGDSGQAWAEILPDLRPAHAKIICPSAPIQKVSLNGGMMMPAWFDLRALDEPKDEFGIKSAASAIYEIIQSEIDAGIPSKRIVLGGFSQGGAVALYAALTAPFKLAGILALSTWLPISKSVPWENVQRHRILQLHGEEDEMVSIERAKKSGDMLKKQLPENYTFKAYKELGHTISLAEEQEDISQFFKETLPVLESKL